MFLGWYDPDKKIPARSKLEDALERYARKFGRPAQTCMTSPEDAAELEADKKAPTMPVRGVGFIPRYTFYVGIDDEPEEVVKPTAQTRAGAGERKTAGRKVVAGEPAGPGKKAVAKKGQKPGVVSTTDPGSKPRPKPSKPLGSERGDRTSEPTRRRSSARPSEQPIASERLSGSARAVKPRNAATRRKKP